MNLPNLPTYEQEPERTWEWRAIQISGCGALAAVLSFLPPALKDALHTRGVLHSWLHVLTFAMLAAVFVGCAGSARLRFGLFLAALLLGCGVELAQALVYGYPLERLDVASDSLGVLFGAVLRLVAPAVLAIVRQRSRWRSPAASPAGTIR